MLHGRNLGGRHASGDDVEVVFDARQRQAEGEEEMRTSSLWLTLSHLLFLLILSACEQDEVCETESCGENELSDVSSYT